MTAADLDAIVARLRNLAERQRDTNAGFCIPRSDSLMYANPHDVLALLDALNEARKERDDLQATLLARHGGEPLALLKELDAARADLREALALLDERRMAFDGEGGCSEDEEVAAFLARHKEAK